MATAAQVTKAILQTLLVQDSEATLQPDEFQDTIFAMNNFMLALDAEGVSLGYTEVSNLGDEITIPTGALRGLIYNVAIEMAPQFNAPITPGITNAATAGMDAMRQLGQIIVATQFPGTLPVGSGNEGFHRDRHFYPDLEAEILAETSGAIGLEVNTNEVADNG